MADPPPLRLALPPDLVFEGSPSPPPPSVAEGEFVDEPLGHPDDRPVDAITTTLRSPELFGIELGDPLAFHDPPHRDPDPSGGTDARFGVDPAEIDPGVDAIDDAIDDDGDVGDTSTGRRVRPYTITGGRTAVAGPEIPLEAQVLTSNQGPVDPSRYRWETARLVQMLEVPMALIEVAARLEVPVGVARVLVSDLVAEGVLIIHLPPPSSSFTSLLEQVLDGVRKL